MVGVHYDRCFAGTYQVRQVAPIEKRLTGCLPIADSGVLQVGQMTDQQSMAAPNGSHVQRAHPNSGVTAFDSDLHTAFCCRDSAACGSVAACRSGRIEHEQITWTRDGDFARFAPEKLLIRIGWIIGREDAARV